jgi:ATP-dependent helicase/nuclease subunit B
VSAHLRRWEIQADDSAGVPLSATTAGTLLLLIAQVAAEQFDPSALLAVLKHPLVGGKELSERQAWLDGARKLDLALRGPLPGPGLTGIDAILADQSVRNANVKSAALDWWAQQKGAFAALDQAPQGISQLNQMIQALTDTAALLTKDSIWAGGDGRAVADLLSELSALAGGGLALTSASDLPLLLRDLMDAIAIRPAFGGHPRVFIWGLIEAKLQRADTVILGGLNEGVWPQLTSPDPWLAPAIRRQLGLPALERRIGLSAHDLVGAMGAGSVLMTRAKRDGSSPTSESRFWLRLSTLAGGFEPPAIRYDLLNREIDYAVGKRAAPPKPSPPAQDRPRALSVTDVDTLKADPYSFYAKAILRLSALDEPGAEPDAKWRGTFLHDILHLWGRDDHFAPGTLVPRLQRAFDQSGLHPVLRALWLPRFEQAAQYFDDQVAELVANGRVPAETEVKGEIGLAGVTLRARADRIDRLADGSLGIVDYKTGGAPSVKQVQAGMRLQLGLLGIMAERGAFPGLSGSATEFDYWSQAKDSTAQRYGKISSALGARSRMVPSDFLDLTLHHFEQVVSDFLLGHEPFHAKLHPELAYSEFDQLMRYDEWQGSGN